MSPRAVAMEVTGSFDCTRAATAPRLVRMLVARGADRHTAEELAQDTGVRVWAKDPRFSDVSCRSRSSSQVAPPSDG